MKKLLYIILAMTIVSCLGASSTSDEAPSTRDSDSITTIVNIVDTTTFADTTLMALSPQQVDSLVFRLTHHYSNNFNFIVKADSLTLTPRDGDLIQDTCRVYDGDLIAVAEIKSLPGDSIDSIWVKVAHDQYTMGWIPEHELLQGTTPDGTISQLLDALSSSRAIWMSAFVALGIFALFIRKDKSSKERLYTIRKPELLKFDEMASPYPVLFVMLVALMASLYASVQNFVPEFWQEYYYHPTLNPLLLPPLMASLVVLLWLVIITFVAVIDEVYHHFYLVPGVTYLIELCGIAMLVYLIISWTTLVYIGYPLLLLLLTALIWLYIKVILPQEK